jgi:hypothetical protein
LPLHDTTDTYVHLTRISSKIPADTDESFKHLTAQHAAHRAQFTKQLNKAKDCTAIDKPMIEDTDKLGELIQLMKEKPTTIQQLQNVDACLQDKATTDQLEKVNTEADDYHMNARESLIIIKKFHQRILAASQ